MNVLLGTIVLVGLFARGFAYWKAVWIGRRARGSEEMVAIGKAIREGAMAFIQAEYQVLAVFVVIIALLLSFFNQNRGPGLGLVAVSFIVGALCSALAGFIGMRVATRANYRTTQAATKSLGAALEVAFASGSVMGMTVVGLALLGIGTVLVACHFLPHVGAVTPEILQQGGLRILAGFSMGPSSSQVFARLGGGICSRAAVVWAECGGGSGWGRAGGGGGEDGGK